MDYLTDDTQNLERNGERSRFRESMKTKEGRKAERDVVTAPAQSGHFEDRGGSILRAQGGSVSRFSRTFDDKAPILTDRGSNRLDYSLLTTRAFNRENPARPIHLPFDRLQPIHVTFHRAVAPSRRHRRVHRRLVAANAFGKMADLRAGTDLGPRQPLLQRAGRLLADQCREVVRKVQGGCQIGAGPSDLVQAGSGLRPFVSQGDGPSRRRVASAREVGRALASPRSPGDASCRPVPDAW